MIFLQLHNMLLLYIMNIIIFCFILLLTIFLINFYSIHTFSSILFLFNVYHRNVSLVLCLLLFLARFLLEPFPSKQFNLIDLTIFSDHLLISYCHLEKSAPSNYYPIACVLLLLNRLVNLSSVNSIILRLYNEHYSILVRD